jgi:hypothetical protein
MEVTSYIITEICLWKETMSEPLTDRMVTGLQILLLLVHLKGSGKALMESRKKQSWLWGG